MALVWSIFDSCTCWADHVTWGDVYLCSSTERSEIKVTSCVIVFVVYVCCMWDDEEKEEGETQCRHIAYSCLQAPKGLPGLTYPSDRQITINGTIRHLYMYAEEFRI